MIGIEKLDNEETLVTFTVEMHDQDLYDLYNKTFTRDYFKVLGIDMPIQQDSQVGGDNAKSSDFTFISNPFFDIKTESLMQPDGGYKNDFDIDTADRIETELAKKTKKEEEEANRTFTWTIEISKSWGTPVLTENEYKDMKKASVRPEILEQDKNGFTVHEMIVLAENEKVQQNRNLLEILNA